MHNLSNLEDLRKLCDVDLSYEAVLNGFWGQIWATGVSTCFHAIGENGDSVHRSWITAQQRELHREVESFRDRILGKPDPHPGLIMTAELFLVALCFTRRVTAICRKVGS